MTKRMTHMTPEQAQIYLRAYRNDRTGYIPSYAVDALKALAADTLEYGVADANGDEDIEWFPVDATVGTAEDARQDAVNYANSDQFFRLVARRVSAPWEVTNE